MTRLQRVAIDGSGAFRQGSQLAEGKKSADVKHSYLAPPPSACQLELAEWVEFLEKYAHFADLEAAFGGGGRPIFRDDLCWSVAEGGCSLPGFSRLAKYSAVFNF